MKAKTYNMTEAELQEFIKNSTHEELKEFQTKDNELDIRFHKKHFYYSLAVSVLFLFGCVKVAFLYPGLGFLIPGSISLVFGLHCWIRHIKWSSAVDMKYFMKNFFQEMGI